MLNGSVGSCVPNMTQLFLTGKTGRVGLPGYFRVIIVSRPDYPFS
jgi:hypothetical protein